MYCPSSNGLCQSLQALSSNVWHDLQDAITFSSPLHEEAITQYNSLMLTRNHWKENFIYQFNKMTEEPKTGADWLWVFFDSGKLNYIVVAVQAKRLYSSGKYDALKTSQTQKLIDYANNQHLGCIPIYVFYNHPGLRVFRHPIKNKNWRMAYRPNVIDPIDLGCTFVNAHVIKHNGEAISKDPQSLSANTRPWWHLACQCRRREPRSDRSDPLMVLAERLQDRELGEDDGFVRPISAEGPMRDFLSGEGLPEEKMERLFGIDEIDPDDPDAFSPDFVLVTRIDESKEGQK